MRSEIDDMEGMHGEVRYPSQFHFQFQYIHVKRILDLDFVPRSSF